MEIADDPFGSDPLSSMDPLGMDPLSGGGYDDAYEFPSSSSTVVEEKDEEPSTPLARVSF